MSNPSIGAQNVAINSEVTFTFFVPMAPVQAITWSANVVAANFTYSWSPDGTILTANYQGDLPAQATITWTLDPAVFKDKAGTPLLAINNSGSFTTGSGSSDPNDPCSGTSTNTAGSATLSKSVHYLQTGAGAPVVDPEMAATFSASVVSPKANPVTEASLQLPNGTTKILTNLLGRFFVYEQFATQEALDAAYPSGAYKIAVKQATGASTITLNLGTAGVPPTPQIANYAQTQAFDPTADFNLQWLPFTGAAANDSLFLQISDNTGAEFHAPDPCIPIELPNTATSITIPKNTFGAGGEKDGSLTFSKMSGFDTNTVPDITAFASSSKTTQFMMRSPGGSQPDAPELQNLVRQADGSVRFEVKATVGVVLTVEGSSDLKVWLPITTAPAVSGLLNVLDPLAASLPQRFYRAIAAP